MAAFVRWGDDALTRFRGSFALALWNRDADRLLLACDHFGRRPIYYTRIDGLLVFATQLGTLLALPEVPRYLNDTWLSDFLCEATPEPDATAYAAIRRVPAACCVVFERDREPVVREYWHLDWERRIHLPRDQDYVEEARALLDQAVRRQLEGTTPVVCELSGGLDSAGVTATAARLLAPATVHALTRVPPPNIPRYEHQGLLTDEGVHAQAVAARYPNVAWEALASPSLHPIDEDPLRLFVSAAVPFRNMMNIGWLSSLYDRARALGASVVLTGAFGNMTLSWHGLHGLPVMAKQGQVARLWREVGALARNTGRSPLSIMRQHVLRPLLPAAWQAKLRGGPMAGLKSAIHPEFARETHASERRIATGLAFSGDSQRVRRKWLTQMQRWAGGFSSFTDACGLELRDPTADIDLLEFCFAVPDEQYLRDGTTRWLARRVLADRLPPQVINETRRGFQCPEFLHRMTLQRDRIVAGVSALEHSFLASRVLDIERMKWLAKNWPTDAATTPFGDYGAVLHRGLHIGQFLLWVEGANQ